MGVIGEPPLISKVWRIHKSEMRNDLWGKRRKHYSENPKNR
jgi:hypothetical protein